MKLPSSRAATLALAVFLAPGGMLRAQENNSTPRDAAEDPRDPHGWSVLRWGMTRNEVEAALRRVYPSMRALPSAISGVVEYKVEDSIGSFRLVSVRAQFAQDRLIRVFLNEGLRHFTGDFSEMRQALSEKYGEPRPFSDDALHWSPGGTSILLHPRSTLLEFTMNMWLEYADALKLGELAREAARATAEKSKKAVEQAKTKL